MKFPSLREYKAAISDTNNINIPFFKSGSIQIFLNKRGLPYMSVGGFGAVFQFKDKNDNQYALKVFTRDAEGREERYRALHDTLQITKFPFMVDFHFVPDGLKVGRNFFPVVVMEWGQGVNLDMAIENDLADDDIFQSAATISGNLVLLAKTLQEWKMGHGDFQEGNLLIGNDDKITLIDYDGMFVPYLDGQKANEIGLADYQHPKRNNSYFGNAIDDFSLLSIIFQLSIISPALWKEYHGDKRLILTQNDYKKPKSSEIIKFGLKSPKKHVKILASMLAEACKSDPLGINAIEKIENESTIMDWLIFTEETKPIENFASIIKQVVSLTDEQVQEFESDKLTLETEQEERAVREAPKKIRKADKKGSWEEIVDFFYEEEKDNEESIKEPIEETIKEENEKSRILDKVKKGVVDLLFEEEEKKDEEPTTEPQQTTQPAVIKAASKKNKTKTKSAKKVPALAKKEDQQDNKTAPLPDWVKKRKGY